MPVLDGYACLAAGMSDYLSKPFTLNHVFEMLEKWVPLQGSDATAVDWDCIDGRLLEDLSRMDPVGKTKLVEEVLELFEAKLSERLSRLNLAFEARDIEGLKKASHNLNSSVSALGGLAISRTCDLILMEMANGQWSDVPRLLTGLRVSCINLRPLVERWCKAYQKNYDGVDRNSSPPKSPPAFGGEFISSP